MSLNVLVLSNLFKFEPFICVSIHAKPFISYFYLHYIGHGRLPRRYYCWCSTRNKQLAKLVFVPPPPPLN